MATLSKGKELYEIDKWIYEKLSTSPSVAALVGGTVAPRIYSSLAPQGATLPFIVYDADEAVHETGVKGDSGCVAVDYAIRAVSRADTWGSCAGIAEAMDAELHQSSGTVTVGTATVLIVNGCVRMRTFRYVEVDHGNRYNHMGAVYRIWAYEP